MDKRSINDVIKEVAQKAKDVNFGTIDSKVLSDFIMVANLKGLDVGVVFLKGKRNDNNRAAINILVEAAEKLKQLSYLDTETIAYTVGHLPAVLD